MERLSTYENKDPIQCAIVIADVVFICYLCFIQVGLPHSGVRSHLHPIFVRWVFSCVVFIVSRHLRDTVCFLARRWNLALSR